MNTFTELDLDQAISSKNLGHFIKADNLKRIVEKKLKPMQEKVKLIAEVSLFITYDSFRMMRI